MKVRLFSVVSLIASLALLLAPVGGASSTVAEGRPASAPGSGQGDDAHFQMPGAPTTAAPPEPLNALSNTEAHFSDFSAPSVSSVVQDPLTPLSPGTTTRVSVASDGSQGNNHSWSPSISADGRYVAFDSYASNLVGGDTNGKRDVFVHDRQTGQTTRVSVASDGSQGNDNCYGPSISADGRYVAFGSSATNLVSGDTNGYVDVFVHDRQTGQTTRVSVASDGGQGNGNFYHPSISADGRYVAFDSYASNLVGGDANGERDVFVHDQQTGQTTRVSVASDGTQGNGYSEWPSISADGRYVAFESQASNLVSGDTNGTYDVFVHDRQTGQTTRVSVASDGGQGNDYSWYPSISADGRYVAFVSWASNLVGGDTNGEGDVFVHDRQTGQTTRVSLASDGSQGNDRSCDPSISAGGRYVAFRSYASNLVGGDTNGEGDVFVHDRQTAQTTRVSLASDGGQGNYVSWYPSISADGRYVAFASWASNLVGGDTNGVRDIFVHDRGGGGIYSISGHIRDSGGNPIPDVVIWAGAASSTTTTADGYYVLSGLDAGAYTLTPVKSGYTFSPPTRTVSVPPDATGQDFTGSDLTELITEIQDIATSTSSRLDQVLTEAHDIAQDGDYFAVAKDEHQIDLIADAIIDAAGILADGFDAVEKVKSLSKVQFPGVIGRGWGHILDLKDSSQTARDAFRDALQRQITGANASRAAKEFLNGASIYYAADALDTAAEDLLGDGIVKYGWKVGLQSDLALQTQLYPAQQRLVDIFKQDVVDTGDETTANIPFMTPTLRDAYIEDLNQRDLANNVMAFTLARRALPLHLARDDRESGGGNWIANFLAKYLIKGLAFLRFGSPAALAVDVGAAYWNLYQNSRRLDEDIKMMNLAAEGMGGALEAEKHIYLNAVHGMDNIVHGIEPQIARGSASFIVNESEGEYRLFGRWFWCERSSYSEVNVSNSTSYDTVYQVIANYGKTGFLGMSYQPLVSEGARVIPGDGSDTVRVYYKRDDEGVSPDEDNAIEMDLLGSTDTGTYRVTHDGTTWTPTRVTASGVLQVTTQAQAEAPTIPYPIRTRMAVDEDALTYTPYIWVDNPFTQTVVVTLTQALPADVQVVDANGGSTVGNSLRWQRTISPQVTVEITHVVRYLGEAGQVVHYPEPQLEMTDLGATVYVTFTGKAETFISQPPLSAVGTPPADIVQGESITIPITVTNRLADEAASGTVRLSLIDFEAETEVYSDTHDVSVPAGRSQVVELRLDTTDVSKGDYLLVAVVESNGGQEEAFAEYLSVKLYRLCLPLILRNR